MSSQYVADNKAAEDELRPHVVENARIESVYTDEELEEFAEEPFAHWREEDFENEASAERMRPF